MNFNVRLKQLRQKHKLTQSELADILGLKPTAISNYESKRNEPSFDKLIALSKHFDVSCDYLLGVSDAYLPIGGEVLDKDIINFFNLYQQLDEKRSKELLSYADYLLYLQEKEKEKTDDNNDK
jgi:transcriptional regulator with XRE-family HTH domain